MAREGEPKKKSPEELLLSQYAEQFPALNDLDPDQLKAVANDLYSTRADRLLTESKRLKESDPTKSVKIAIAEHLVKMEKDPSYLRNVKNQIRLNSIGLETIDEEKTKEKLADYEETELTGIIKEKNITIELPEFEKYEEFLDFSILEIIEGQYTDEEGHERYIHKLLKEESKPKERNVPLDIDKSDLKPLNTRISIAKRVLWLRFGEDQKKDEGETVRISLLNKFKSEENNIFKDDNELRELLKEKQPDIKDQEINLIVHLVMQELYDDYYHGRKSDENKDSDKKLVEAKYPELISKFRDPDLSRYIILENDKELKDEILKETPSLQGSENNEELEKTSHLIKELIFKNAFRS
jgi:hypothetical protein